MRKVGEFLKLMREGLTKFMTVISSDHNYIHDGIGFSVNHLELALASAASAYLGFTTPPSGEKYIHWRPTGVSSTESGVVVKVFEGDSFTGGTDITPFNRNRLSSNTSDMQSFKKGVTSTPTGVLVGLASVGSGGNAVSSSGGGSSGAENEIVLKQNTNYVIELENIGAVSTDVSLNLFWYEETAGLDV